MENIYTHFKSLAPAFLFSLLACCFEIKGATLSANPNSNENRQGTPGSILTGTICNEPTIPTLTASATTICKGSATTITISTGSLNDATSWNWYSESCGGIAIGTGTSITVSPLSTCTYFVRGEGGCVAPGACANITITVNENIIPTLTITSDDSDNKICSGANVTFTATSVNGGIAPAYQWKLNNNNLEVNSATYTNNALSDNDIISCFLTSNAACASPATVSCESIEMTVIPNATPAVTITSDNMGNKICSGTNVSFTATPVSGGANPAYQWKLNNNNVGANAATYSNSTLANGDVVTCMLTSNAECVSQSTASSNLCSISVNTVSGIAITKTVCDSYILNNQTYVSSGVYTQKLLNANGCDSIITLNLTVNNSTSSIITAVACNSYTLNYQTYSSSGTYTQKLLTAAGCDSTITLNLTINNSTSTTITEIACNDYTLNDEIYTTSGTYVQKLLNATGCDSTIMLNLTILKGTSSTLAATACDSYTLNNETYTATGTYTQYLLNAVGCDSTITINLILHNSTNSTITTTVCNSYTLNNKTYTASGIYIQTLLNAAGCDSIITLNLTVNTVDTSVSQSLNVLKAAASSATFQWIDCTNNNNPLAGETNQQFHATVSGNYAVIITQNGCTATSSCYRIVTLGLSKKLGTSAISLLPNPTNANCKLNLGQSFTTVTIQVTDVSGKLVYIEHMKNTQHLDIILEKQAPGMYYLLINADGNWMTGKVVKYND